ncbi:MAG TPA: hypothetical protein VFS15_17740 [Kofleriaceae bacterium]|nr:hypothetical protein [Kofleriaceae bacterium]
MTGRQRWLTIALSALAPACVKVPPFQYQDGGPGDSADASGDAGVDDLVRVVPNATGATATGPGYTFDFSTAGSHFPSQLTVGGHALLGGAQECADEQGMGIAIYPVARVNGEDTTQMGTPQLTIPLSGPYVGQLRIAWSTSAMCGGDTETFTGHSTYSFFPDGRLTRFDVAEVPRTLTGSECNRCDSGTATTFFLTSYTTLVVDDNAYLSDGAVSDLNEYGSDVTSVGSTACVRERGQTIAFAWTNANNRLRGTSTTAPRWVAFVHDIYADMVLPMGSFEATTQIGVSTSADCPALESRISQFTEDVHQLDINGTTIGAALGDGIYGGDPRPDGFPVDFPVTLAPGSTTNARIPAGFAVWLRSNGIPVTLTVEHSRHPTGTWYHEQRVSPTSVVFWFDVSLEIGETITISGT